MFEVFRLDDTFDEIDRAIWKSVLKCLPNNRAAQAKIRGILNIFIKVAKTPLPGVISSLKIKVFLDDLLKLSPEEMVRKYPIIFAKKGRAETLKRELKTFEPQKVLKEILSLLLHTLDEKEEKFFKAFSEGLRILRVKKDPFKLLREISGTPYLSIEDKAETLSFKDYRILLINMTIKEEHELFEKFRRRAVNAQLVSFLRWPGINAPYFSTYHFLGPTVAIFGEIQMNPHLMNRRGRNSKVVGTEPSASFFAPVIKGYEIALFVPFIALGVKKKGAKLFNWPAFFHAEKARTHVEYDKMAQLFYDKTYVELREIRLK